MELLLPTDANLRRAGACLAAGGLVAFPTETVYGLGADALDVRAVARVFDAKARPSFDPLIVHIAALSDIDRVAGDPCAKARVLMERLWPGPLTLILPKRPELPDLVTSGLPTVALRFPDHPVARAIIAFSGTVVAGPSANPFGYLSPTKAEHVARMLGDKVDMIVDGGQCEIGVESTVVDMTVDPPMVLRQGGMAVEEIEREIGALRTRSSATPGFAGQRGQAQPGPGLLESHYAPHTPLRFLGEGFAATLGKARGTSAALLFDSASLSRLGEEVSRFSEIRILSPSGDLVEAAAALFALLHELDGLDLDTIWAERVPDRGLGRAINDRLYKASRK